MIIKTAIILKRVNRIFSNAFVICILLTAVAFGQQTDTGALTGTVTDQASAFVAGATVTVTNNETGLKRTAKTNDEGRWTITPLKPGNYLVTITATGFDEKQEITAVSASVTTPIDIQLSVEGSTTIVTVGTGEDAALTGNRNGELGTTLSSRDLQKAPLINNNVLSSLSTNTGFSGELNDPNSGGNGNPEGSINGGRPTSVALVIDGIDATNLVGTGSLTENIAVSPEFITEVKVITGNYGASLGRTGGGNVQLVTKSGGQKLSGSVFLSAQNEAFNANDFFFNRDGIDRQKASRIEGGFSIGGPIIKERLFFFGGYQKTDAVTGYVPTAQSFVVLPEALALLTGNRTPAAVAQAFGIARRDFQTGGFNQPGCIISRLYNLNERFTPPNQIINSNGSPGICINTFSPFFRLLTLRNPVTGDFAIPTLRPGYQILIADPTNTVYGTDVSRFFPNGIPIVDSGRENQFGSGNPLARQRNASPAEFKQDQFTTRLDATVLKGNDKGNNLNTIAGTFFFANFPATEPFSESTAVSPFPLVKNDKNRTLAITDTHIFNASLINEARFGYFSLNNSRELDSRLQVSEFSNSAFGIPNPASVFAPGPASERCAHQSGRGNLQDFSVCAPNDIFNKRKQITLTVADNLTYVKGSQTFRFGVEYKRNSFDTSLPEEQGTEFEKFDNFGLALVGFITEADTAFGITDKKFQFNDLSFYATNDWQVNTKLSLNLGLRWDWFGRPSEKNGQFTNFDPSLVTNPDDPRAGFLLPTNAGQTGFNAIDASLSSINRAKNKHTLNGEDLNNFAPRVGFSYSPFKSGTTVISGGYGIFYDRPSASFINTVYSNYPYLREIEERVESIPYSQPYNLVFRNQSTILPISGYLPFRVGLDANTAGNGTQLSLYDNTQIIGQRNFAEPLEFRAVDRDLKTPLVQQWNLGIQQQLGKDWLIDARYIGSRGQQLLLAVGFNQPYDLSDPNTPDYIFRRLNEAYIQAGQPQGPLRTGTSSERQRGCGIAFGNTVIINPIPGFAFPAGPACVGVPGLFDYNLDRGPAIGDSRDIIPAELRVPYLVLDPTDAIMLQSRGYSAYHAGQLNVSKRLSKSYSLSLSYTISNSIDIGSTDPGSTTGSGRPDTPNLGLVVQGDQRNINSNRARSDFDRRHRFAGSFVWELPNYKSTNTFLGGWQLSGFVQWQSGTPFSIFGTDVEPVALADGSRLQESVFLGQFGLSGIVIRNPITGEQIITTRTVYNVGRASGLLFDAAFGRPNVSSLALLKKRNCKDITRCYFNTAQRGSDAALFSPYGRFGNLGRNILTGPSQKRFDLSLQKTTKINERVSLQVKWDIFNVFNLVNFANPNGDLTDETDFGQITRTVGAPRVMQFGFKLQF